MSEILIEKNIFPILVKIKFPNFVSIVSSSLPPLDKYREAKTKSKLFSQVYSICFKYLGSNEPSALKIQR